MSAGDWADYWGRGAARVAIYARVSTVEQSKGYSLSQQVEELRTYNDRRGGKVAYLVKESESGGSVEGRPRLERLLGLAEAGRFSILLVWKIDRLGRTNLDLQNLWAFFKALGVDVVSATEPFDSTTVQGKLLFDMNAMLAE